MSQSTNRLTIGILAHVDAGKTTLAEQILYRTGMIAKAGRVDHRDAFLDHHSLERKRGITIFSKQAELTLGEHKVTLLDTPGHVDFAAEMERALQVMDAAIMVINASDGVQGHTRTIWNLLKQHELPVFLFINKMDLPDLRRPDLLRDLQNRLDIGCMDFGGGHMNREEAFYEDLVMNDEHLMEQYLNGKAIGQKDISSLVKERKIFPCYFGSALKGDGVADFLRGLEQYAPFPEYGEVFGARVFKISRDDQNRRLTFMKITGGSLRAKSFLEIPVEGGETKQEKADQIRIYSGGRYHTIEEAEAGLVCAVTGLELTCPGMGIGIETGSFIPVMEPVLTYSLLLPEGVSAYMMYANLCLMEEEDPMLHMTWDEATGQIQIRVMGEVQIQILKSQIEERFGVTVEFGAGSIIYKETIAGPIVGMGHFEPLRHYAEVHLLMEPAERGSGLQLDSRLSEDMLDRSWQHLILTHLQERKHKGVLTGSEITDIKITLIAGRAHLKHTEGGDFRQAAYRAVRQGLLSARSILLEPVYQFQLEIPSGMLGRAMSDIQRMQGKFDPPRTTRDEAVLIGSVPVAAMQGYQSELLAYTKGCGRLFCSLKGYEPCHDADAVIAQMAYCPEADMIYTGNSVFCAHGAGFIVEWDRVAEYMHVENGWQTEKIVRDVYSEPLSIEEKARAQKNGPSRLITEAEEKELAEIFQRAYRTNRSQKNGRGRADKEKNFFNVEGKQIAGSEAAGEEKREKTAPDKTILNRKIKDHVEGRTKEEYLLVDGYNIIFAWQELRELAEVNLEAARGKLADILCNYQGYTNRIVILVFDAYRVEGNPGEHSQYLNIHIVYTKEAETADMYIEKTTHEIGRKHRIMVATSDLLEQMIVWGEGAERLSAEGLKAEIFQVSRQIREEHLDRPQEKNYLFDYLTDDLTGFMEDVRLGKRNIENMK